MLIHFPVALWPAHWALQVGARWLPPGAAAVVGWWLLAAGCALGWLAAFAGAADLVALARAGDARRLNLALVHAGINGTVLGGFTVLLALEWAAAPAITPGRGGLLVEALLLVAMFAGNYFGGALVWGEREQP
jgi:uncharacterized membrane protein